MNGDEKAAIEKPANAVEAAQVQELGKDVAAPSPIGRQPPPLMKRPSIFMGGAEHRVYTRSELVQEDRTGSSSTQDSNNPNAHNREDRVKRALQEKRRIMTLSMESLRRHRERKRLKFSLTTSRLSEAEPMSQRSRSDIASVSSQDCDSVFPPAPDASLSGQRLRQSFRQAGNAIQRTLRRRLSSSQRLQKIASLSSIDSKASKRQASAIPRRLSISTAMEAEKISKAERLNKLVKVGTFPSLIRTLQRSDTFTQSQSSPEFEEEALEKARADQTDVDPNNSQTRLRSQAERLVANAMQSNDLHHSKPSRPGEQPTNKAKDNLNSAKL